MQFAGKGARSLANSCARSVGRQRSLHCSRVRHATTTLTMPAMSPTMTEGGIASWKKKQGESFVAGDVLLEIETDKATIDVEAPEDGVLGLIITGDGAKNVPVGKVIALLAEEGDDISNLKAPEEQLSAPKESQSSEPPSPSPAPAKTESTQPTTPKHAHAEHVDSSKPIFPSVHRLLLENGITSADKIKGTGVRGMLTKGDVLAHLGKVKSPFGTYKEFKSPFPEKLSSTAKPKETLVLDGVATRKLIVASLIQASKPRPAPVQPPVDFDSIISDYIPQYPSSKPPILPLSPKPPKGNVDYLDGLI
ncbi:single hybrid motif-containing protein [Schizopora paradoxa]|uniref:Single hybrid motif-containing protein n=1 Tax=Schizopora paradoxa TaxID=27342 RepID=A0A0H2SA14_9AGAM|nr:single hybrid motif-containing protein [Schizopora paradoxa]